jgi:copper chaperone CopZ
MTTDTATHSYSVTGMTCEGCARKIAATLRSVPGVVSAAATLKPPEARLELSSPVSTAALNQALALAGAYRLSETPAPQPPPVPAEPPASLYPLYLIVGYIAGAVGLAAISSGDRSLSALMTNFMAGFFLVFSFFKFLDLGGFSDAYRSYDLLARAWPAWGWIYPFVECALGVAYLLRVSPVATNAITLVLMLAGSAGVLRTLLDKRAIRCACLGTAIKLPMTTVTLVEDLGMAAMAAAMLAIHIPASHIG